MSEKEVEQKLKKKEPEPEVFVALSEIVSSLWDKNAVGTIRGLLVDEWCGYTPRAIVRGVGRIMAQGGVVIVSDVLVDGEFENATGLFAKSVNERNKVEFRRL